MTEEVCYINYYFIMIMHIYNVSIMFYECNQDILNLLIGNCTVVAHIDVCLI